MRCCLFDPASRSRPGGKCLHASFVLVMMVARLVSRKDEGCSWILVRVRRRIAVADSPGRAALHAGRVAVAEVADKGQTRFWVKDDHVKGAGFGARRAGYAVFTPQEHGRGAVVSVQGIGGTGGYARCPPAQAACLRGIQSLWLVLEYADTRCGNTEETLVAGNTRHLTGPTTGAEFGSDDYPIAGHRSGAWNESGTDLSAGGQTVAMTESGCLMRRQKCDVRRARPLASTIRA